MAGARTLTDWNAQVGEIFSNDENLYQILEKLSNRDFVLYNTKRSIHYDKFPYNGGHLFGLHSRCRTYTIEEFL